MVAIRHDAADHGSLCGSACSCAGGDRQRAVTERENGAAGSGDEGPLPVTTSLTITGNAGARTATLDHLQRLRHAERRRYRNWTRRQRLQQHPRRHLQRLLTGARPGCADRKQARSGRRALAVLRFTSARIAAHPLAGLPHSRPPDSAVRDSGYRAGHGLPWLPTPAVPGAPQPTATRPASSQHPRYVTAGSFKHLRYVTEAGQPECPGQTPNDSKPGGTRRARLIATLKQENARLRDARRKPNAWPPSSASTAPP